MKRGANEVCPANHRSLLWRLSDSWFLGHCQRILHVSVHLLPMTDCPAPVAFRIFAMESSTFVFWDKPNL